MALRSQKFQKRVEIGSQVRDDSVVEAELVQDVANEANHSICRELCDCLIMSRPQHASGHKGGMMIRLWAGTWGCLFKN
jgi:hypothetical protein